MDNFQSFPRAVRDSNSKQPGWSVVVVHLNNAESHKSHTLAIQLN